VRDNFHALVRADLLEGPDPSWQTWAMLLDEQLGQVLAEFASEKP